MRIRDFFWKLRQNINPVSFMVIGNGSLIAYERSGSSPINSKPKALSLTASGAVKYGPAYAPIPVNPELYGVALNALSGTDRGGADTLTVTGPERYRALPGARVNYCHNPSFETNTNGWGGGTATIQRVGTDVSNGAFALEITASGAGIYQGCPYTMPSSVNPFAGGQQVTVSFDTTLKSGNASWSVQGFSVKADGSSTDLGEQVFTPTSSKTRKTFTFTLGAGAHRLSFYIWHVPASASLMVIDAVQIEPGAVATAYFDASLSTAPDAKWMDPITGYAGTAHASPSVERAGLWVQEATTNATTDPSFEAAAIATGWQTNGSAVISKVATHAYVGAGAGKVSCTASVNDGIRPQVLSAAATGQAWSMQARVRAFAAGDIGKTIKLALTEWDAANAFITTQISSAFTLTDAWQLATFTATLNGGVNTAKVVPFVVNGAAVAVDFVLDAHQHEQKAYATAYCDGSLGTGHTWSGTANASASSRTAVADSIAAPGRISGRRGSMCGWFTLDVINASQGGNGLWGAGQYYVTTDDRIAMWVNSARAVRIDWGNSGDAVAATPAISGNAAVTVGTMFFVYAEWDDAYIGFSLNNGAKFTGSRVLGAGNLANNIRIGMYGDGSVNLDGFAYGVQFFDQPLQPEDQTALYNGGVPVRPDFTQFAGRYMEVPRTNLVFNPCFTNNVTGWTTSAGGSQVRVTDSVLGPTANSISGSGVSSGSGPFSTSGIALTNGKIPHTVSFDAVSRSGATDWKVDWYELDAAGSVIIANGGSVAFTAPATPTRLTFAYVPTQTGTHRVTAFVRRVTAVAGAIDVTNVVIEPSYQLGTPRFFCGMIGDGVWIDPLTGLLGSAHASPSMNQVGFFPEEAETENVPDPIFGNAAISTYWGGAGTTPAVVTKDTTYGWLGAQAAKVVCGAATDSINGTFTTLISAANGQTWTGLAALRGTAGQTVKLDIVERDAGGTQVLVNQSPTITLSDSWILVPYTVTLSGGGTVAKVTIRVESVSGAQTFWVGYLGLRQKGYATSPVVGSLGTGYTWAGTAHASASTRAKMSASVDEVGRVSSLRGSFMARVQWLENVSTGNKTVFAVGHWATGGKDYESMRIAGSKIAIIETSNGTSQSGILGTNPTLILGKQYLFYMEWNGTVLGLAQDELTKLVGARAAPSGVIDPNNLYLGSENESIGVGQQIDGIISNILITDLRPLTDAERTKTRRRALPWTWDMFEKAS